MRAVRFAGAVNDLEALELELAEARELEMDYLKAYVRAPVSFMRRIADVAAEMGVPNGSHFLSPGIQAGMGAGAGPARAAARPGVRREQPRGAPGRDPHAARYAHADHELGTVEPGKIADLIFVRGDPLEDVANAARVERVMKNSVVYTLEEIPAPYR